MGNYPDWVTKHKKKGTYVNKVGDKYYLYAAHSERIKGTRKVKRVHDGYLGRITPEGFIPAKDKISGTLEVYEFGLSKTIFDLTLNIQKGVTKSYKKSAKYIFVRAVLLFMYTEALEIHYKSSWISMQYPNVDVGRQPNTEEELGIERTVRMIQDVFSKHFGDDQRLALQVLPLVHLINMELDRPKTTEKRVAHIPDYIMPIVERYGLDLRCL